MKQIILAIAMVVAWAFPMKADDFGGAVGYASPGIKRIFGAPDRFGEMIRNGYPMVWRPQETRFPWLISRRIDGVDVLRQAESGA